jgi:2-dehydropantoate 2-reductase
MNIKKTQTNIGQNIIDLNLVAIIGQGKISSHIPKLLKNIFNTFVFLDKNLDETNSIKAHSLSVQGNNINDFKNEFSLDEISSVILAVQDQNIESVYLKIKNKFSKDTIFYHLSGTLSFESIIGIHPLMTFTKNSKVDNYSEIPLYTDSDWFYNANKSKLQNLRYISPDLKTQYHAMAVMMGNFTQYYLHLLKQNFPDALDFLDYKELTLKSVESIFSSSSSSSSSSSLTGPMVRKDHITISNHKSILKKKNPKLFKVYELMEQLFQEELFSNEN